MFDILRQLIAIPVPFNMITLIGLAFAVSLGLAAIAKEIRKFAETRQILEFKRELVDRGLAADEIERVLHSSATVGMPEQCRSQRATAPYAGAR